MILRWILKTFATTAATILEASYLRASWVENAAAERAITPTPVRSEYTLSWQSHKFALALSWQNFVAF